MYIYYLIKLTYVKMLLCSTQCEIAVIYPKKKKSETVVFFSKSYWKNEPGLVDHKIFIRYFLLSPDAYML